MASCEGAGEDNPRTRPATERTTLITPVKQHEPTWEIIGDQPLTDEALDALASLLLEDSEVDLHQGNGGTDNLDN